jgi:hypothetical protein
MSHRISIINVCRNSNSYFSVLENMLCIYAITTRKNLMHESLPSGLLPFGFAPLSSVHDYLIVMTFTSRHFTHAQSLGSCVYFYVNTNHLINDSCLTSSKLLKNSRLIFSLLKIQTKNTQLSYINLLKYF